MDVRLVQTNRIMISEGLSLTTDPTYRRYITQLPLSLCRLVWLRGSSKVILNDFLLRGKISRPQISLAHMISLLKLKNYLGNGRLTTVSKNIHFSIFFCEILIFVLGKLKVL